MVLIQLSRFIRHLPLSIPVISFWRGCHCANAVNLVYLWLARCRSRFMREFCTNLWNFHLSFLQTAVMLVARRLSCCVPAQYYAGSWGRLALWIDQPICLATSVLAWFGTPIGIKCSMYLVGSFFDFPQRYPPFSAMRMPFSRSLIC